MRFLIDAHLPASLAAFFPGHDVVHTAGLAKGNLTTDSAINTLSVLEERILITKDTDFYYSFIASRKPYKLVLVKLGNMRIKDLKQYFENNAPKLISLLEEHAFIILEPGRIRVLL